MKKGYKYHPTMSSSASPPAYNYCVSFIDLLGQRAALNGQTILKPISSEEEKEKQRKAIRDVIKPIKDLQERAKNIIDASRINNNNSQFRAQLSANQQKQWDEMAHFKLVSQNWSDGMMYFSYLGDAEVKCDMNSIFRMFTLTGLLCFKGLALKQPLRGAIEIAWGVELNAGELHGAAVARAYELESVVAKHPRIVVGPGILEVLDTYSKDKNEDPVSQLQKIHAINCLNMLKQDTDGYWMIHYLGKEFQFSATYKAHKELYSKAKTFLIEQINEHRVNEDCKLVSRYEHLLQYFDDYQLSTK